MKIRDKIDYRKSLITVYGPAEYVMYLNDNSSFPHIIRAHNGFIYEYNDYGECFNQGIVNVFNSDPEKTEIVQEDE